MAVDDALLEGPAHTRALRERLAPLLPIELKSCLNAPGELAEPERAAIHTHLTHLLAALNVVVPRWLLDDAAEHGSVRAHAHQATLLFADVTGFTPLTARLGALGRIGTEYLTQTLNRLFTTIVPLALAYDGDLLAFGGDAILVAFCGPDHALTAAVAAWQMQHALASLQLDPIAGMEEALRLQMKIGLASGPLVLASVGTQARRVPLALGAVLDTTDAMANATSPGGIRLDARAAAAAAAIADLSPQPDGSALLVGLCGTLSPSATPPSPAPPGASIHELTARILALAPYLPPELFAALAGTPRSTVGDGEQRQVISLFSHLAGLHRLADALGPERAALAAEVASLALGRALTLIESHGGVLARVDAYPAGHKLLALFGAPVAYEQQALRAAQAALALRDALPLLNAEALTLIEAGGLQASALELSQPLLSVRSGLQAGPVLAGLVGSPSRWEYTVMGDSVNVAARLMSRASLEHSEVLAGPALHEQLGEQLVAEARMLSLKGKDEPLEVWSLQALRPLAGAQPAHAAPLVGREQERQALRAAAQALHSGAGCLVFVRGEAGIGKTRLVRELPALLGPEVAYLQSGSPGFVPVSFGLFQALLLALSEAVEPKPRIREDTRRDANDDSHVPEQLRGMIERVCPGQGEELWPALKVLLGLADADPAALGDGPEAQQRLLAAAVLRILSGAAAERPLAWLCEDLHEVDGASLALLEQMLTMGWQMPLLVCATLRTSAATALHPAQRLVELASQRFDGTVRVLELGGLNAEAGTALLEQLLPQLALETCAALLAHTSGNPLFLEVLAQTVREQNLLRPSSRGLELRASLETLGVPRTLRELVTAQVDRLAPEVRRVARAASVIAAVDHSFPAWLLEQIMDEREVVGPRLRALEQAQVVEELLGEQARRYTFRHALYQQAAYEQLLERERQELHRRAGLALHERAAAGQEAGVEALAYHCYEGRCWELAAGYSLAAGRRAQQAYANREARRYLRRALSLARRLGWPQQEAEAREGLGELYTLLGRYTPARAQLEHALRLGAADSESTKLTKYTKVGASDQKAIFVPFVPFVDQESGELSRQGDVALLAQIEAQARRYRLLARIADFLGEYDRAEAECRMGLALARSQLPATNELPQLYEQLAVVLMRRGMLGDAENACREGLATLPPEPVALRERIDLLQLLGALEGQRGNYHAAIRTLEQCLSLARSLGNPAVTPAILRNLGLCFHFVGQRERAFACYQESLSINERTGDIVGQVRATDNLGLLHLMSGDYDSALRCLLECCRLAQSLNLPQIHANATVNIGQLHYMTRTYDQAMAHFLRAHTLFSELDDTRSQAECLCRMGDVALAQGEVDLALRYAGQALANAQQAGSDSYEASALRVIGEALLAQQRLEEAAQALERARQVQTRVDDPFDHVLLLRATARLALVQGDRHEAAGIARSAMDLATNHQIPYLIAVIEDLTGEINSSGV